MFIGEYIYTIDSKKRLAIPSKFRKELGKKAVVTRGLDNSLVIYSFQEWKKVAENLQKFPTFQQDSRGFTRIMFSGAAEVEFDKLGRILIPDYLKEYASLKKNIALIGISNKIEIWAKERWEVYKKTREKNYDQMAEKMESQSM